MENNKCLICGSQEGHVTYDGMLGYTMLICKGCGAGYDIHSVIPPSEWSCNFAGVKYDPYLAVSRSKLEHMRKLIDGLCAPEEDSKALEACLNNILAGYEMGSEFRKYGETVHFKTVQQNITGKLAEFIGKMDDMTTEEAIIEAHKAGITVKLMQRPELGYTYIEFYFEGCRMEKVYESHKP